METLTLNDIIHRSPAPAPWSEGEKIPWNDPEFSRRMLDLHLSQDHDWASRRLALIDQHIDWIEQNGLRPHSRVLDLGCGPGLYTSRLARRGHQCVGIDFSPASIEHARETAERDGLAATYQLGDIRQTEFGDSFDLVMMVYGELNVFRPSESRSILAKAFAALKEGGMLLVEPHTFEEVKRQGQSPPWWQSAETGLFSDSPHLWLQENFWHDDLSAATTRYLIVETARATVRRYASTMQAYPDDQFEAMLQKTGFVGIRRHPNWTEEEAPLLGKLQLFTATKGS